MSTPRPLVSVILPAAADPALLAHSIASVAAQSLLEHAAPAPRVELLVAAATLPPLPPAAPANLEVRAILPESSQGAAGCNQLLRAARGDAVAWLQPGDTMAKERLAEQWQVLESDPALGGTFSFARFAGADGGDDVDLAEAFNQDLDPEELAHRLLLGNVLVTSSAMVRGSILRTLGEAPLDEALLSAHEFDLWCRLVLEAPVRIVPLPLVHCRLAQPAPVGGRQLAHESWMVACRHAGAIMRRWPTLPQTNYAFFSRIAELAFLAGDYNVTIDYLNLKRQSFGHDDDDCLTLVECLLRQDRLPQAVALLRVLQGERRRLAPDTMEKVSQALTRLQTMPGAAAGEAAGSARA